MGLFFIDFELYQLKILLTLAAFKPKTLSSETHCTLHVHVIWFLNLNFQDQVHYNLSPENWYILLIPLTKELFYIQLDDIL